jgi:hypothetical protein
MSIRILLLWLAFGIAPLKVGAQGSIPSGTIIPVRLNSSLSSQKTKVGQTISARVAQDVPLSAGARIHEGAKILGHVTGVREPAPGSPAQISLVFDRLVSGNNALPITTSLRALASAFEVDQAQIPPVGLGEGDTWSSRVTQQIGGDTVYWGGGPVEGSAGPVGKPVDGIETTGVLVTVSAKPGSPCRGEVGDHMGPQALWVFSSDACGVYGVSGLTIAHAGRAHPIGVIELSAARGQINIRSGSAALLRVIGP